MAQREIKFRAWDGKQMLTMDTERYSYPVFVCKDGYTWLNWDDYIKMQFTGLKDKNGVDIYEGDILRHSGEVNAIEVIWHAPTAGFGLSKIGWTFTHYFREALEAHDCTVIGNIYENPELLEP